MRNAKKKGPKGEKRAAKYTAIHFSFFVFCEYFCIFCNKCIGSLRFQLPSRSQKFCGMEGNFGGNESCQQEKRFWNEMTLLITTTYSVFIHLSSVVSVVLRRSLVTKIVKNETVFRNDMTGFSRNFDLLQYFSKFLMIPCERATPCYVKSLKTSKSSFCSLSRFFCAMSHIYYL